jgi:hypothetical protein
VLTPDEAALDDLLPLDRPIVDAHVHLFPDALFDRPWHWLETQAWPIRRRLYADQVVAFLQRRSNAETFDWVCPRTARTPFTCA